MRPHTLTPTLKGFAALLTAGLLAGCAALNTHTSEVSSFGEWPTARTPGTYAVDRLPSQTAQAEAFRDVEDAARRALEGAGFTEAPTPDAADVLVQVGARVQRQTWGDWDDPLWWRGGFIVGTRAGTRQALWFGPRWAWGAGWDSPRYDREVALLLRDRASGKPLYETRARSDGPTRGSSAVYDAMFRAAMADFPAVQSEPHAVSVQLP